MSRTGRSGTLSRDLLTTNYGITAGGNPKTKRTGSPNGSKTVFRSILGKNMKNMTGKEYMQRIRDVKREIRLLEEQILRQEVYASNAKAIRYDIDRVQTSPVGDNMAEIVADIVESTYKLRDKILKLMKQEDEARLYLVKLREEHERVLVLHYFDGLKWEDVAEKIGYDDKYIYNVKNNALDELTQVLTKSDEI